MAKRKRGILRNNRAAKLAKRLGAEELARRLGVSPSTVKRWARDGVPKKRQPELRGVEERSNRARKAAKTRKVEREYVRAEREAIQDPLDQFAPPGVKTVPFDPSTKTRLTPQQKAWRTRRKKQFLAQGISDLGSRDWAELTSQRSDQLLNLRNHALGPAQLLRGVNEEDRDVLEKMMDRRDARVMKYLTFAEELGYTSRQARTALFSPKARSSLR